MLSWWITGTNFLKNHIVNPLMLNVLLGMRGYCFRCAEKNYENMPYGKLCA